MKCCRTGHTDIFTVPVSHSYLLSKKNKGQSYHIHIHTPNRYVSEFDITHLLHEVACHNVMFLCGTVYYVIGHALCNIHVYADYFSSLLFSTWLRDQTSRPESTTHNFRTGNELLPAWLPYNATVNNTCLWNSGYYSSSSANLELTSALLCLLDNCVTLNN